MQYYLFLGNIYLVAYLYWKADVLQEKVVPTFFLFVVVDERRLVNFSFDDFQGLSA